MNFDAVLRHLGEFGTYQKRLCTLLWLPGITTGMRMVVSAFIQFIPEHRCVIPGLNSDTYAIQSHDHARLINESIPFKIVGGRIEYDPCRVYIRDPGSKNNDTWNINHTTLATEACNKWVYDSSVFVSTAVSQYDMVCDNTLDRTNAQSLFMAGFLVGVFVIGAFSDRFGRKTALMVSLLVNLICGFSLNYLPEHISYTMFRFLLGASSSGIFTTSFVMSVEIVGASKRVFVGVFIQYTFAAGELLICAVAYFLRHWHHIEIVCTAAVAIFLSYWWLIPESPRWLVTKGRTQEAEVIVRKMAKVNKVTVPEHLFAEKMEEEEKGSRSQIKDFLKLFTRRVLLIRTLIIFFNWFVISMLYYGVSLNTRNLGGSNFYLTFAISGLVEFPGIFLCNLFMDRWGRKRLLCVVNVVGGTCCLLTIFTILYASESLQWMTIILAMIGKMGSAGCFANVYVFSSELFPTVVRNVAVGASSSWARAGAMMAPYIAYAGEITGGDFGRALPLLVFGSVTLAAGLLALVLPETLNKDLPETIEEAEHFGRKSISTEDEEVMGGLNHETNNSVAMDTKCGSDRHEKLLANGNMD
ncbi:organic cation transporter protein-like [Gigantopelta aegis]|uniref:organic cation transporter protein-like n=1 Tax=Gigantopelta aegis TaxID=1735272 RepID=UPI001B8891D1|nr:organic cation transporter protein-like [Gigantopelta aegis]XP_041356319.1 organic cation transporter protein-like [Gigantopelta aegis]